MHQGGSLNPCVVRFTRIIYGLTNHIKHELANNCAKVLLSVVRSFFARIRRLPEDAQVKAAMRREENTQAKALKDAEAAIEKASKAVAVLEDEAVKALTGEARLDLSIINQLMPKQKAALEQARLRLHEASDIMALSQ